MPPCLAERGTFLSSQPFIHLSRLDYSNYSKDHEHVLPSAVHVRAYGGVITPFKWMLREHAWNISEELGLDAQVSREPQEGKAPQLIVDTPWVQECDNQRNLLEGFRSLLGGDGWSRRRCAGALRPPGSPSIDSLAVFDDGSGPELYAGDSMKFSPAGDSYLARWGCDP